MVYEYALDPALLDNWKDFRFFQQSFGPAKGRLIADFPRKWKRAVLEAIRVSSCGDVEKKRIKEALKYLAAPTIYSRTVHCWNNSLSWLENAVQEDAQRAFHAIVYRDNNDGVAIPDDHFVQEEELFDSAQYWESENTVIVERKAIQMAAPAAPLLSLAQHIIFVDPYFDPCKKRFRDPLLALLDYISNRPADITVQKLEYHVSDRIDAAHFQHLSDTHLKKRLSHGLTLSFVQWAEADMHDRHIVTNIGALTYGQGLDEWDGGASPKEVRIQREGNDGWKQLWDRYSSGTPFHSLSGP